MTDYPDNPNNTPDLLRLRAEHPGRYGRCATCGEVYSGNGGGHCTGAPYGGCCETFTSDSSFDAHRTGPYDDRACLPVAALDGWRRIEGRGWTDSAPMTHDERARVARRG